MVTGPCDFHIMFHMSIEGKSINVQYSTEQAYMPALALLRVNKQYLT